MDTSTDPSRGFALKALKIFLLTMLNVSLISISSLAFALPVVNLTLDHGDMSEATLSTGMFTVTRSVDENFDQPLQVRFVFAGTATNGADYNTTDQGYISHLKAEMTITDDVAEVTLTLDDGEMDEATLGTGKFTVTRTTNGKLDAPLQVRFVFAGTATNGADYNTTDQGYISHLKPAISYHPGQ
jgi:hypothetical protein